MSDDKILWTLDLIENLLDARIGEPSRLDIIKFALENGRQVYENDRQYLIEKFRELKEHQTFTDKSIDFTIDYYVPKNKSANITKDEYCIMILKNRLAMGQISTAEFDALKEKIIESNPDKIKYDVDAALNELENRMQKFEKRLISLDPEIKLNTQIKIFDQQTL